MIKTRILLKLNAFWLALFFCLTLAQTACAQQATKPFSIDESPLPAPTGFVNDYAGVIDADTKQKLEARLKDFKEKTNPPVELAVAIVKTTGDRPIFDYSIAVARGWKIGSKEDDNPGALLIIAIDDRKYFTQVSRNLEDELPDGVVGQLQRQYLVPAFKQGNYGKGVTDTIEAYIRTIEAKQSGEPVPPTAQTDGGRGKKNSSGGLPFGNCMTCLIILFIILIIIFSRGGGGSGGRRNRNRWGGGGFGGSALPWIIGSAIANSGSSSSGWGSGGSSDSGGFGGFGGGGDFGGGGAGGDW